MRDRLQHEAQDQMRSALVAALGAAQRILLAGGSALDAVIAAVVSLENEPRFNAGRGSVLTSAETVEMDAAVMCGRTRRAGAVACARKIQNPILAAKRLLDEGGHVLLCGDAADDFAARCGLQLQPQSYFITEARLKSRREAQGIELDHGSQTVGAVAIDSAGYLAAATSTGGLTNKAPGRIGDTPLVGAGTWADERVAVSATGRGELIMRAALAHAIAGRMRYTSSKLEACCISALHEPPLKTDSAGCISIAADGQIALPFNTAGMARGLVRGAEAPQAALFNDENLT